MSAADLPDPVALAKAEARKAAFARRKAARAALGPAPETATEAVVKALLAGPEGPIAGYLPIRTEIDPRPAMTRLHEAGRRICAPVIQGPALPLKFREWTPDCALAEGPFGAQTPAAGDWLTPAALIVPLVAFDPRLFRLGYGGGFYDRTLAALAEAGAGQGAGAGTAEGAAPFALGLAYAAQRAESLPLEPTDQPLSALASERGLETP